MLLKDALYFGVSFTSKEKSSISFDLFYTLVMQNNAFLLALAFREKKQSRNIFISFTHQFHQ